MNQNTRWNSKKKKVYDVSPYQFHVSTSNVNIKQCTHHDTFPVVTSSFMWCRYHWVLFWRVLPRSATPDLAFALLGCYTVLKLVVAHIHHGRSLQSHTAKAFWMRSLLWSTVWLTPVEQCWCQSFWREEPCHIADGSNWSNFWYPESKLESWPVGICATF